MDFKTNLFLELMLYFNKVQIFRGGINIWKIFPTLLLNNEKLGYFFQILWPSQNYSECLNFNITHLPYFDRFSNNSSPGRLAFMDGISKEIIQKKIWEFWILGECVPRNEKYTQKLAAFSTGILIEILEEFHIIMIHISRKK